LSPSVSSHTLHACWKTRHPLSSYRVPPDLPKLASLVSDVVDQGCHIGCPGTVPPRDRGKCDDPTSFNFRCTAERTESGQTNRLAVRKSTGPIFHLVDHGTGAAIIQVFTQYPNLMVCQIMPTGSRFDRIGQCCNALRGTKEVELFSSLLLCGER
jgi:hypothetical protein